MIKRVNLFVFVLFIALGSIKGQNLTSSPYSYFGIGDIEQINNGQTQGLGGTGIGIVNKYHLNLKNPASYASFDTLSFKFEFGAKSKFTTLKTNTATEKIDDFGLSFLAMGFPITKKWHTSIALLPMSSVGYKIKDAYEHDEIGNVEHIYTGEGGLNQLMLGNSFKINNNFAIGLNASYTFGKLTYYKALLFSDLSASANSIYESKLNVKGFSYQFGMQYNLKVLEKYNVAMGFTFDNQSNLSIEKHIVAGSTFNTYTDFLLSSTIYDTIFSENTKGDLIIPTKIGMGFSVTDNNHFIAAIDYEIQQWEDSEILGINSGLANYSRLSGGLEYTPIRNHPKFFRRLNYRIGGNYSNSYLTINNTQLSSYGVNFGIGVPVRRTKTSFNINFEYGQRGTTENNLIKENYAIISLTLSLSDIWFYKRKYD